MYISINSAGDSIASLTFVCLGRRTFLFNILYSFSKSGLSLHFFFHHHTDCHALLDIEHVFIL